MLGQLAKNGGVIMVTFVPSFISPEVSDHAKREDAEQKRLAAATTLLANLIQTT